VRELTDELLQQQHYQHGMNLGRSEDVERFIDRLWDTVASFVNALIQLQETNPLLYWLVVVGLVVVAAGLIWHVTWSVRRSSRTRASTPGRIGELLDQADARTLWAHYREALADGDLGLALRYRFAIAVGEAIGVGRLQSLGHLTYRELVGVAQRHGWGDAAELDQAVAAIEESLYAGRPLDEARFSRRVRGLGGGPPREEAP